MASLNKIFFGREQLPGYIVGKPSKGAVMLVQEWWGITDCIKRQAEHVAEKTGYQVLVPDLYKGKLGVDAEEASHMMDHLDFPQAARELTQAAEYLRKEGATKVGCIGFCMGGALSFLAAMQAPIDAAVAFYGRPEGGDPAKVKVPCQAHSGSEDSFKGFADPPTMKAFCDGITKAGGSAEFHEYKGEGHGFMNEGEDIKGMMQTGNLPMGSKDAQKLAWDRTFQFLAKHM